MDLNELRPALSCRPLNALKNSGINTTEDLEKYRWYHMGRNCGAVSTAEIAACLDANGIHNRIKDGWPTKYQMAYIKFFQ